MIDFAGRTDSETTTEQRRRRLLDLPPSAKLAFKVLELASPLTQQEIAERSRLSARTTRHAIGMLKEEGLVDERVYIPDARKRIYEPRSVAPSEADAASVREKSSTGMTE